MRTSPRPRGAHEPWAPPRVLGGARPCDAGALRAALQRGSPAGAARLAGAVEDAAPGPCGWPGLVPAPSESLPRGSGRPPGLLPSGLGCPAALPCGSASPDGAPGHSALSGRDSGSFAWRNRATASFPPAPVRGSPRAWSSWGSREPTKRKRTAGAVGAEQGRSGPAGVLGTGACRT